MSGSGLMLWQHLITYLRNNNCYFGKFTNFLTFWGKYSFSKTYPGLFSKMSAVVDITSMSFLDRFCSTVLISRCLAWYSDKMTCGSFVGTCFKGTLPNNFHPRVFCCDVSSASTVASLDDFRENIFLKEQNKDFESNNKIYHVIRTFYIYIKIYWYKPFNSNHNLYKCKSPQVNFHHYFWKSCVLWQNVIIFHKNAFTLLQSHTLDLLYNNKLSALVSTLTFDIFSSCSFMF